jgi:very-short-patch-repair endonuclease
VPPRVNTFVEGEEVDLHRPAARLIVETDGAATHLTPTAFEQDRARDAKLTLAGYRVIRFTWRQLTDHPDRTAQTIRALLAEPNGANL